MCIAFGICVRDSEEAEWAVEGLDALTVVQESIKRIPRCRSADSEDSFITLMPRNGAVPAVISRPHAMHASQLDVDFDQLDAVMKDERTMAQWRTCLERLDVPYQAPKVYPVLCISP